MTKRKIKFYEIESKELRIKSNKTIMECARECVNNKSNSLEIIVLLNYMRLFKQGFLPCKLMGKSKKECIEASKNRLKSILFQCAFYQYDVTKQSKEPLNYGENL